MASGPTRGLLPPRKELSAGGKKVYKYQITNIGSSLTLGTFCHENGHMLCGYPDIYDYDYDSNGGAGGFCLMNSGGHGTNPVLISAYLKRAAGWTTTTELTSSSNLIGTLMATVGHADYNKIYRYANPAAPATEYFLFENRQKTGRDANIAASGIAIWHVDELGDQGQPEPRPQHLHANYEVTLVQADNLWHFQNDTNGGDSKDLYYLGNTAAAYTNTFSDNSSPDAHWWSGAASGLNVSSISSAGATMTLQFGLPANTILSRPRTAASTSTSDSTQTDHMGRQHHGQREDRALQGRRPAFRVCPPTKPTTAATRGRSPPGSPLATTTPSRSAAWTPRPMRIPATRRFPS